MKHINTNELLQDTKELLKRSNDLINRATELLNILQERKAANESIIYHK